MENKIKNTMNTEIFLKQYKEKLDNIYSQIDSSKLEEVVSLIMNVFNKNKRIYVCGNGGSAATASHMQADFTFYVRYFTNFRPKVTALTDNLPVITAIGNDTSFDDIFVEQLKGNFEKDDLLICISASGNSENVIRAAKYANKCLGKSVAFVGFEGGELNEVCSTSLFTQNPKGDYGPIEDIHMIYVHIIINYLCQNKEFLNLESK